MAEAFQAADAKARELGGILKTMAIPTPRPIKLFLALGNWRRKRGIFRPFPLLFENIVGGGI